MKDKPTYQELTRRVQQTEKNPPDYSSQMAREAHLKNVLLAIRDVNQLIARETDPEQLIRDICTSLVRSRGYYNAWIALTDEKGEVVESSAAFGFNGGFDIMESSLHRGEFPMCMHFSLWKDNLAVTQNPLAECPDCPLSSEYEGRAGLTCRLSYKDRVFGILSVSVPEKFAHDNEEQDLFAELAADLGFALSKLNTDVQAHRLHQIVTSIPQPMSLVSDDYRYLAVNDVYAALFGTVADNIVGKTPAHFFGGQVFEREIKPRLDHVLAGKELQYEIQVDFPGRGKRWMFMSYYPYRDEQGNIAGVISHGHDITERKQAEEALHRERERLASIIEGTNVGTWEWNVQTGETIFNERWAEIIGYSLEEISPVSIDTWKKFAHPDDLKNCEELFQRHFSDELTYYQCESRMRHRNGGWVWVLDRGKVALWTEDGNPLKMMGTHQDITERKQADEQLRLQSLVLNQIQDRVTVTDLEGVITYVNDAEARSLGYSKEELIGESMEKFGEDSEQGAIQQEIVATTLEHGKWRGEVVNQTVDGRRVIMDCRTQVVLDEKGNKIALAGISTDITERKKAEVLLRESEARFKALHNAFFGGITIHDKGIILECNHGLSEMTGYSVNELIGMDGLLLIAEKSRSFVMSNILSGYEKPYEAMGVRKNGEEYPIRLEARNIPYKGKQVRTVEFRDITDQKLKEAENERLQNQLSQAHKMESVGRLAGGVAHDFNNMLGVILGHTELALLQADENHDLHSDLKEIQKAAKRSADITKQLLAFARKEIISPRQIDLNDTVENMLNMLRRLIGEDIDLIWKPSAHLWPVKMDSTQIDQILVNLCVNARDAISGVGKLTIETGKKIFDETYCNENPGFIPGDFVMLAVSDNGCGINKDTLENLFEPFFTTKEVGKGTGLGLATVYGIVKQNNGFINVYSEPDQGSTFKIYLSRLAADEDEDKTVPEKKTDLGGSETILLVEDEPTILRMTRMMLERKGYSVLTAATPAEAIGLAETHADKIHLLMSDVVMPEMNGRDLAGQITALYPGIRLLFMSGYTADVIAHQGILDDGVAFIQKPFSMADMTVKVREVLDTAPNKNQG
jgi:PAS domain S-box-containing protein